MTTQTRFTPGPWEWVNRDSGSVMLQTPDRGRLVVMAFARKGMRLAEPRFAIMDDDQPRGRRGGILRSMSELIACGQTELPPDAALIEASPDLYAALEALTDFTEWSLARSELYAEEFRRETGMLAPFKDAGAMANEAEELHASRAEELRAWCKRKRETLINNARTALKRARG